MNLRKKQKTKTIVSCSIKHIHNHFRLLETVEAVAATLPIPENETFTVIPLTSFAVTAQDVQVEDIGAQTFSALIGFDAGRSIEPMDLVFDAHPNATASITIPATVFMSIQLPSNMTPDISIRITNAVYLNDLLFLQRAGGSQRSRIGSVIISTSIRSNDSLENFDPPVNLTFVKNPVRLHSITISSLYKLSIILGMLLCIFIITYRKCRMAQIPHVTFGTLRLMVSDTRIP